MIANWLDEIDADVRTVLQKRGCLSAWELGRHLDVSEETAVSYIGLLAASGRLVIERVSLPENAGDRRAADDRRILITAA